MPSKPPLHRPQGWKPPDVRRREFDRQRMPEKNRMYDDAWRKLRAVFLRQHPVCCEPGCGRPSVDVDHIESVRDRPDLRLTWSNLRAFCHPHHSARTSRDHSWNA